MSLDFSIMAVHIAAPMRRKILPRMAIPVERRKVYVYRNTPL
jgi:hypothetical protein